MRSTSTIPRRLMLGSLVSGVIVACAFMGTPRSAEAQPGPPRAEVLVIHGTTCATPYVDPAIGGEVPPLKHNCWKLLDRKFLPLTQGQSSAMVLPNGRTFQVVYNGLAADKRHKIGTFISKPSEPGFISLAEITAEPHKRFHVGGFAHANGTLVLAIRIVP